jgi:Polysaccharide pyruvyl transferase
MKYAAFCYSTDNIGDDFQTIAAMRRLPRVDLLIDRDRLDEYHSPEKTVVVMNGWFTPRPQGWPPSSSIAPIFVGFHLNEAAAPALREHGGYLTSHGPIGCRDRGTADILAKWQVPVFVSYCLTLTFPRRDRRPQNGKIAIVDAGKIMIPSSLRRRSIAFSHLVPPASAKTRLQYAQELLDFYRNEVSLAITTRRHCALPCMAMGIPVVFFGERADYRVSVVEDLGVRIHSRRLHRRVLRGVPGKLLEQVDWSPAPVDLGAVPNNLEATVSRGLEAIQ